MGSKVQVFEPIDSHDMTMTIPPGNKWLIGAVKERLKGTGWKLVVDHGPTRTVGTVGSHVDLATGDTFRTRYRLEISQWGTSRCFPYGGPEMHYDLSLVDNATGEEVITQSGIDCQDIAADKFVAALNGKAK